MDVTIKCVVVVMAISIGSCRAGMTSSPFVPRSDRHHPPNDACEPSNTQTHSLTTGGAIDCTTTRYHHHCSNME